MFSALDLSTTAIIASGLALLIGGLAKGSVGVGLPLIGVPVMANFMSVPQTLMLLTVPIFLTNIWQAIEGGNLSVVLRRFWPMAVALAVGIGVGAQLLIRLDDQTLYLIMGSVVLVQPLLRLAQPQKFSIPGWLKSIGPAISFISGVIGGVSGFFGPLVMAYLASLQLQKDLFTATIAMMFTIGGLSLMIFLSQVGLMRSGEFLASSIAMIPVAIGVYLGQKIRSKISQIQFERALTAILLLTGISLLAKAF